MAVEQTDGRRGLGALLRDLAEGSGSLVRNEITLARLEVAETARAVGMGTGMVATGGVLALLGALALLAGLIMLAGDQWLRDRYWLAALIVLVLSAGLAAWFAKRGMALVSPRRLAPDQTVATLKEDKEWLKRQLTSGATSR
jgi:drug/metabolite transporter (DMT)-like permease